MNTGLGVMLQMLGGNSGTVETIKKSIGKVIKEIDFTEERLRLTFDDFQIEISDDGQSCCELRYMTCDDELKDFVGGTFDKIEIREAPETEDEYGEVHEVQFLLITTNKGVFTIETHNEHNGYYGGFLIVAKEVTE